MIKMFKCVCLLIFVVALAAQLQGVPTPKEDIVVLSQFLNSFEEFLLPEYDSFIRPSASRNRSNSTLLECWCNQTVGDYLSPIELFFLRNANESFSNSSIFKKYVEMVALYEKELSEKLAKVSIGKSGRDTKADMIRDH